MAEESRVGVEITEEETEETAETVEAEAMDTKTMEAEGMDAEGMEVDTVEMAEAMEVDTVEMAEAMEAETAAGVVVEMEVMEEGVETVEEEYPLHCQHIVYLGVGSGGDTTCQ